MLGVVHGEFRLVADPELRFSQSGTAVANLRLVASSRKRENDEWVDDKTLWISAVAFNALAENIAASLGRGDRVVVIGKAHTDEWETPEGEKRSKIALTIDHLGPSLAFRTASLASSEGDNNRSQGGSQGGSQGRSQGRQQGGQQQPPRQRQAPQAESAPQEDEPPF